MKTRIHILSLAIAMLLPASCIDNLVCVDGDGVIRTEQRRVTGFGQIVNSTEFDVVFTKADTSGIAITADRNIIGYIVTETSGGILEIKTSPNVSCFDYIERPVIRVSSPSLSGVFLSGSGNFSADYMEGLSVAVKLSGSGDISVGELECEALELAISGSGNIAVLEAGCKVSDAAISGSGDMLIDGASDGSLVRVTGSGDYLGSDFIVKTASVTTSGSGNTYTHVIEKLDGTISGSGNIYVKGNPVIDVRITGSGRVIRN